MIIISVLFCFFHLRLVVSFIRSSNFDILCFYFGSIICFFFNTLSSVVEMSTYILMTIYFNIWVGYGSVSTDRFFSQCGSHGHFCMPDNFGIDVRHCEFYLAGCWIFSYSCKYFWALSWNMISYFEMVSSFLVLFLRFIKQDQSSIKSSTNYFPPLRQPHSPIRSVCRLA